MIIKWLTRRAVHMLMLQNTTTIEQGSNMFYFSLNKAKIEVFLFILNLPSIRSLKSSMSEIPNLEKAVPPSTAQMVRKELKRIP